MLIYAGNEFDEGGWLAPAFTEGEYPGDIEIGRDLNPMFERKMGGPRPALVYRIVTA